MLQTKNICVFGAVNVDITGFTHDKLIYKDANMGSMKTSSGGVGRNIAENLSKLDFNVELISVFGDDPLSDFLKNDCREKQLKIDNSLFLKNKPASSFIAIMDNQNDLALGISAMQLYDDLDEVLFLDNLKDIQADYIVLETNFSANILQKIRDKYRNQKLVLDTVSGKKALRAIPILSSLYILKTNLLEAEMMSGLQVKNDSDLLKLTTYFIEKGVQKVFITLGKDGVVFGDNNTTGILPSVASKLVNTIGAGDSFVAGLVYADALGKSIAEMAKYGIKAAAFTVQHEGAVHPKFNTQILEE